MKHLPMLLAGLAACAPYAAQAQPVAELDTRSATVHLTYGGGFATASKNGTAGTLDPIGLAGPATLGVEGTDSFVGSYLGWAVNWQMAWNLQQTWRVSADAHTLSGSGDIDLAQSNSVIGTGCEPSCPASVAMTARNWQDLQFTLAAGRWQVVNSRTAHVLGSTPPALNESWRFDLTLADARWVSAVPEPASALTLACGLGLLAWGRRARCRAS
jgi:hypothetical protein